MPRPIIEYSTLILFRHKGDKSVLSHTFRGENHAVKAAQFAVANKNEWDYHSLQSIGPKELRS